MPSEVRAIKFMPRPFTRRFHPGLPRTFPLTSKAIKSFRAIALGSPSQNDDPNAQQILGPESRREFLLKTKHGP